MASCVLRPSRSWPAAGAGASSASASATTTSGRERNPHLNTRDTCLLRNEGGCATLARGHEGAHGLHPVVQGGVQALAFVRVAAVERLAGRAVHEVVALDRVVREVVQLVLGL